MSVEILGPRIFRFEVCYFRNCVFNFKAIDILTHITKNNKQSVGKGIYNKGMKMALSLDMFAICVVEKI